VRATIAFDYILDIVGQQRPLWEVKAADTLTIRNLSPLLALDTDNISTISLAMIEYNYDSNTLSVEPDSPIPTLVSLVARKRQ
jgi:hypothetical protein